VREAAGVPGRLDGDPEVDERSSYQATGDYSDPAIKEGLPHLAANPMSDRLPMVTEKQAWSVQPVSSLVEPNTLTAKPTDTAEALVAGQSKRSERGTLVQGDGDGLDTPHDPLPDGPRYAAMGDAVTCHVIEWVGVRVLARMRDEGLFDGPVGFEELVEVGAWR
jgi:hypothetical protein